MMRFRSAVNWFIVATTIGLPSIALSDDRVLVMTISDYSGQPLEGVRFDSENGRKIAQKMGFDIARARVLKDKQLTKDGMQSELQRLVSETRKGDRVFVYFSGHGYSYMDNGQCVQSLISQDGENVSSQFVYNQLEQLKNVASKTVVMLDSCHSAGVVGATRSAGKSQFSTVLASKAWPAKSGEDCSNPANVIRRGVEGKSMGLVGQQNYLFITAAADNEVALDDKTKGGVASISVLKCLEDGVPDLDRSGSMSAQELASCAQKNIEQHVNSISRQFTPHHISLAGNRSMPIDGKGPLIVAPTPTGTPATNAIALLNDLKSRADGRWDFKAWAPDRVALGQPYRIEYQSSQPGYVYVLYVGSDGKDIRQLYPEPGVNEYRPAGSGKVVTLRSDPPMGENNFSVIFSSRPRDFSNVFTQASAPVQATQQVAQNLGCELKRNASVISEASNCPPTKRNASVVKEDAVLDVPVDGFAAAVFKVEGY